MLSIERVLCPIELDDEPEALVEAAVEVAIRHGAQLELLHVWQVSPFVVPDTIGVNDFPVVPDVPALERRMRELVRACGERVPTVSGRVVYGDPARTIVEAVRDRDIDLVVMGTHGHRGLTRLVLGSVAEHVVRTSPVPVLTMPPQTLPAERSTSSAAAPA